MGRERRGAGRRRGAGWVALGVAVGAALLGAPGARAQDCAVLAECSGHGTCNIDTQTCTCISGWGSSEDIAVFKAPDCSVRTCPAGRAWADIPTSTTVGHALAECSNAGVCNRLTGKCTCFSGFEGAACQRSKCPNDCSGHGRCLSIKALQSEANAAPFAHSDGAYGGARSTTTWDEDIIFGCVCDSSWAVGYGAGETQVGEWFGADCSQRRCPSGDDPRTYARTGQTDHRWFDERDCFMKDKNGVVWRGPVDTDGQADYTAYTAAADFIANAQAGTYFTTDAANDEYINVGADGNLCHVECSNRGYCDYSVGQCRCFRGFYGAACEKQDILAPGAYKRGIVQTQGLELDIASLAKAAGI